LTPQSAELAPWTVELTPRRRDAAKTRRPLAATFLPNAQVARLRHGQTKDSRASMGLVSRQWLIVVQKRPIGPPESTATLPKVHQAHFWQEIGQP
jgi:hypothetical protein